MIDRILQNYQIQKEIGKGSHGIVSAATAKKTGEKVAIKLVGPRNFEEAFLSKRALREIKILLHLKGHDNIAWLMDMDINNENSNFNELYLIEGLMEADLSTIIKSNQTLTTQHVQFFVYQILRGLKYMHSANIIHRDLKPGNLLVNSDCELRICDFGLARGELKEDEIIANTEYVATRYYRAPEVVLSPKNYSQSIDLWSVGCILGELFNRKILFKGADYIDQLSKIFAVIGTPEDLAELCSERVVRYLKKWPSCPRANYSKTFPRAPEDAIDLLEKLLAFHPKQRINAKDALSHAFMKKYHVPTDEPSCRKPFDFSFESAKDVHTIKSLIVKEVTEFKSALIDFSIPESPKKPDMPVIEKIEGDAYQNELVPAQGAADIEAEIAAMKIE